MQVPHSLQKKILFCLLVIIFATAASTNSSGSNVQYIYDDLGRLNKTIDEDGVFSVYEYDEVGNLISLATTSSNNSIAILDIEPWSGSPGTPVTIYGKGFSTTSINNTVFFNGTPASIILSTANVIVTSVPAGATSGRVTVQAPLGYATSTKDFVIAQPISITINPSIVYLSSGQSRQFTANVTGTTNINVNWYVEGIESGTPSIGTIVNGIYTAPSDVGQLNMVTISARSTVDTTKQAVVLLYFGKGIAVSKSVSVAVLPNLSQLPPIPTGPIVSFPVSVAFTQPAKYIEVSPFRALYVSFSVGPYISSTMPIYGSQGTSSTIAITGLGFASASTIGFYLNGVLDSQVTVSDIQVNAVGSQITGNVAISQSAVTGIRLVKVTDSTGTSQGYYSVGNLFTVR